MSDACCEPGSGLAPGADPHCHEAPAAGGATSAERRRQWLLAASGLAIAVGAAADAFEWPLAGPWFFALAIGLAAGPPARGAWRAIRARALDINVLMVIAVGGAVALGEWLEAATVVWLFGIAQWLEARSMDRARHAIRSLMTLAPATAVVRRGDGDVEIPAVGGGRRRRGRRPSGRTRARGRRGRRRRIGDGSGAGDRRVLAGREGARRHGVRRDDQRHGRAGDRRVAAGLRQHDRAHHPSRGGRPAAPRADADVRRSVRAPVHAGGRHAGGGRRDRAAVLRGRRLVRGRAGLDLPRARAARGRVPVRARHLDAGVDRLRADRGGAPRRAHQGRRAPRAPRRRARRRVRQDRHADARPHHRDRRARRRRQHARHGCSRWPRRSSRARSIRSAARSCRTRASRVSRSRPARRFARCPVSAPRRPWPPRPPSSAAIGCSRNGSSARRRCTRACRKCRIAAAPRCSSATAARRSA